MQRTLLLVGLATFLFVVALSSCIQIQVQVEAPAWLGGGEASGSGAPEQAVRNAQRESQERVNRLARENLDALIVTAVRIASDVQAWALRPPAFGGPAPGEDIGDVRFEQIGYQTNASGEHHTLDGSFALWGENGAMRIVGTNAQFGNGIVVTVDGVTPDDIRTEVTEVGG